MTLYLTRHGETQMNLDRVFYGWTDCPLNDTGRIQAEGLRRHFQSIPYDKIISSDLLRATATAEIINQDKKRPVLRQEAFRELHFGAWEGKTYPFLKAHYPTEVESWRKSWREFLIPEGESFLDFYQRVADGVDTIFATESEDSNVLLVSHNGVMSSILCHLTGAGPDAFWRFNSHQGSYSQVSFHQGNIVIDKINCPVLPPEKLCTE